MVVIIMISTPPPQKARILSFSRIAPGSIWVIESEQEASFKEVGSHTTPAAPLFNIAMNFLPSSQGRTT